MTPLKSISIFIPCYNEADNIRPYYQAMLETMAHFPDQLDWQLLFIDDGSTDQTLQQIKVLSQTDSRLTYLAFSRNFGKEAGIYAGLQHSHGDYVVIMDVDLQDPPELLVPMYQKLKEEDYDCVVTRRQDRQGESWFRSQCARLFYWLINQLSHTPIRSGERDYRMMTRQMVDSVLKVSEVNRFSKGIFNWVGYQKTYIDFPNHQRQFGHSHFSFWNLLVYSLEGIISFSQIPLNIIAILGLIVFIVAIGLAAFFMIRTLLFGNPTSGWTSTIVIILLMGGLQMLSLGIVGKYIGKTFLESKRRPLYLVKESNLEEDD